MTLEINAGLRHARMPDTRLVVQESSPTSPRPPKLLDRAREANRLRHGSRSTEKSYAGVTHVPGLMCYLWTRFVPSLRLTLRSYF